jgi:hypothetical protein
MMVQRARLLARCMLILCRIFAARAGVLSVCACLCVCVCVCVQMRIPRVAFKT